MQKKHYPDFKHDLLNMFSNHSPMPDKNMYVENTEYIDRYIGPGDAAFYYSLHLKKSCSQENFIQLIKDEINLAKERQRKAFELRIFPISKLDFSPDLLSDLNFKPPRILDFFYSDTGLAIELKENIKNKRVQSDQDFKRLLTLLEQVFGPASETLRQYFNNGLRHEIKDPKNLVGAYITYVNGEAAGGGWIKLYNTIGFLFGGGTLEKFRHKGVYRANIMARLQFAKDRGVHYAVSESSPDSAKALKKLNFNHLGQSQSWVYRF